MKALYWSAVINWLVAVPVMVGLRLLARKKEVMGPFTSGRKTRWFGWLGTGVMTAAMLMMGVGLSRPVERRVLGRRWQRTHLQKRAGRRLRWN